MSTPNPPISIESQKIQKLRDWVNQFLHIETVDGELDIDKAMSNINYSAGNFYTNLNGIYMQEEFKLHQIENDLAKVKALKYDEIKRFTDYQVESAGVKIILDGSTEVREKQLEYSKQKAYLEFLDRTLKQFSFYAGKVDVMIKARETKEKYGGFM